MNGTTKPLTELQIDALRKVDLNPRTPAEIGSPAATLRSLAARGVIFVTSDGLYYVQGAQRENVKKLIEEQTQDNAE